MEFVQEWELSLSNFHFTDLLQPTCQINVVTYRIYLKNFPRRNLPSLNFSLIAFQIEFSALTIRLMVVSKALPTANNIFKAADLAYFIFSEGIEKVP